MLMFLKKSRPKELGHLQSLRLNPAQSVETDVACGFLWTSSLLLLLLPLYQLTIHGLLSIKNAKGAGEQPEQRVQ